MIPRASIYPTVTFNTTRPDGMDAATRWHLETIGLTQSDWLLLAALITTFDDEGKHDELRHHIARNIIPHAPEATT